jgi:hypothetical protein
MLKHALKKDRMTKRVLGISARSHGHFGRVGNDLCCMIGKTWPQADSHNPPLGCICVRVLRSRGIYARHREEGDSFRP